MPEKVPTINGNYISGGRFEIYVWDAKDWGRDGRGICENGTIMLAYSMDAQLLTLRVDFNPGTDVVK